LRGDDVARSRFLQTRWTGRRAQCPTERKSSSSSMVLVDSVYQDVLATS
jgi:hypothetical protein